MLGTAVLSFGFSRPQQYARKVMVSRRFLLTLSLLLPGLLALTARFWSGPNPEPVPAVPEPTPARPRPLSQALPPTAPPENQPVARRLPLRTHNPPSPRAAPPPSRQPQPQPQPQPQVAVRPQLPAAAYPRSPTPAPASLGTAADFLARSQRASRAVDELMRRGLLATSFVGTGVPGEMVEIWWENRSQRPLRFNLVPGMILRPPPEQRVQPLLLDEERVVRLQPGDTLVLQVPSYCMDAQVPAPPAGSEVDYRFRPESAPGQGPQAVAVLRAYRALAWDHSVLPEESHRRAVVQVAVWKALGQRVGEEQLRSALGDLAYDGRARQQLQRDVERLLETLK